MASWGRRVVRILVAAFGLFILVSFVISAVHSTSTTTMVGDLLTGVGMFGLYGSLAVRFRSWSGVVAPFRRRDGEPWGFRAVRHAQRQIDGSEAYGDDDIARLRRLAERRAASRRPSASESVGMVGLMLFMGGIALAPPNFPTGAHWEMVFRIGAVVMLVLLLAASGAQWRKRTDVKAVDFLERTQPV